MYLHGSLASNTYRLCFHLTLDSLYPFSTIRCKLLFTNNLFATMVLLLVSVVFHASTTIIGIAESKHYKRARCSQNCLCALRK